MELLIIRHAQSTNNALEDQAHRVCDPLLTPLGLRQAELLALHLAEAEPCEPRREGPGYGIGRLVCSPMIRALQTTAPIARRLGLRPEVWVDVHEHGGIFLDHGQPLGIRGYPGLTRGEMCLKFPGYVIPEQVTDAGWWNGAYEQDSDFAARAERTAFRLREMGGSDERLAMVTHGGFASQLLKALFGRAGRASPFYHHDNTGLTLLRINAEGWISLRYLNRLHHLPALMIS
jgi:broad specificity phosphatase PhoE